MKLYGDAVEEADGNGKLEFSFVPKNDLYLSIRLYGAAKQYTDSVSGQRPVIGGGASDNKSVENHPVIVGDTGNRPINNLNSQQPLYTNNMTTTGTAKKAQSIKVNPLKKNIKKPSIGKKR